jgi:hypothetical protein
MSDPLHPLVVHPPARIPQESRDFAIAVAAVLACEFDQVGGEVLFVLSAPRGLLQDQLVEREVRNRLAQAYILGLQLLGSTWTASL